MIKFKEITAKELCDGYNKCATDNLKDKFFRDNFKLRTEYIPYTEKSRRIKFRITKGKFISR